MKKKKKIIILTVEIIAVLIAAFLIGRHFIKLQSSDAVVDAAMDTMMNYSNDSQPLADYLTSTYNVPSDLATTISRVASNYSYEIESIAISGKTAKVSINLSSRAIADRFNLSANTDDTTIDDWEANLPYREAAAIELSFTRDSNSWNITEDSEKELFEIILDNPSSYAGN